MDLPLIPLALIGGSVILLGAGTTFGLIRGKSIWGKDKDQNSNSNND